MGIEIHLGIIPDRIAPGAWKQAYTETLTLLEHFPFLERYMYKEHNTCYARRSGHRENLIDTGYAGWRTDGDMHDGGNTETFILMDNIQYYRERGAKSVDDGHDILWDRLCENESPYPQLVDWVFFGKTQGRRSHIPLLAVACLVCDRFPDAAIVYGDITAAQCRYAVQWANQYLDTPIDIPVMADAGRLLQRMKDAGMDGPEKLSRFYELSRMGKNADVGRNIRELCSPEDILNYYRVNLKLPREPGFCESTLREYLVMGFDFRNLCELAMTDPEGPQLTPEGFLKALLEMRLHVEDKEDDDYTAYPEDRVDGPLVDTVEMQFGRVMGKLLGTRNRNVAAYRTLEDICADIDATLGNGFRSMELANRLLAELMEPEKNSAQAVFYDDPGSAFQQKAEKLRRREEAQANFAIRSLETLIDFVPDEPEQLLPDLREEIAAVMKKIRGFADDFWSEYIAMGEAGRKAWFLRRYHVLMEKETRDFIFDHVMDEDAIRPYVGIHCTEASGDIFKLLRALLWNRPLLLYCWELPDSQAQNTEVETI